MSQLDDLIHRADLDELVRHVERTVAADDWQHLLETRDAARAAVSTGRQLWPIATLANHRLALRAPARFAARALDDTVRTFMPGPVSEILAVSHRWEDLEAHLPAGHDRSLFAYERALRGDVIPDREPRALEIPFRLAPWEPDYPLAIYTDDGVDSPPPPIPAPGEEVTITAASSTEDGDTAAQVEIESAFRQLVEPWTASSNGRADVSYVDGDAGAALRALRVSHACLAPVTPQLAMSWLGWAGASGGAHGRRRGTASGRFGTWWLLAMLAGLDDDWPPATDELGEIVASMRWWWWADDSDGTGWQLRLVVEDGSEGTACAMVAVDRV